MQDSDKVISFLIVATKISLNQNSKIASTGSSIAPIKCFVFPL